MNMFWPILLAVGAEAFYQMAAKGTPESLDPFASLTITYMIGALISFILFEVFNKGASIIQEYHHLNWAAFVLGIAIVGLEVGTIFMYKVGWQVNTGYIVKGCIMAVVLLLLGFFVYKEAITWTKVAGAAVCMVGLYLINK